MQVCHDISTCPLVWLAGHKNRVKRTGVEKSWQWRRVSMCACGSILAGVRTLCHTVLIVLIQARKCQMKCKIMICFYFSVHAVYLKYIMLQFTIKL